MVELMQYGRDHNGDGSRSNLIWGMEDRQKIMSASQRKDIYALGMLHRKAIASYNVRQVDQILLLHNCALHPQMLDNCVDMISKGASLYHPDWHGDTVMHYAVRGANMKLIKYIFNTEGFRSLQVINNWHFTLLHTACAETSDERPYDILAMLEWLWMQGMSLEVQDHQGRTPLIWAVTRNSMAAVSWCLSRGAHLGHRDHSGRTSLHMASYGGDEEVAMFLARKGAINLMNETTIDGPQFKPVHLARRKGHFYLSFEMSIWRLLYAMTGRIVIFRNNYAWYYWMMMLVYLIVATFLSLKIIQVAFDLIWVPAVFLGFWILQAVCWLVAFATDLGNGDQSIADQHYRCSSNAKTDAMRKPLFNTGKASAGYKLQLLERQMFLEGVKLMSANVAEKRNPGRYASKIILSTRNLEGMREQVYRLQPKLAQERQREYNPNYTISVLQGNAKKVCLTCHSVKGFRSHHCSDCGFCVYKFDHHCIWVDNCIGHGNYRSFLLFLVFMMAAIFSFWAEVGLYTKILAVDAAFHATGETHRNGFNLIFLMKSPLWYLSLIMVAFSLLWVSFVGYLLIRTTKSMLTNVTFYEGLRKPQHIQRRYGGQVGDCMWEYQNMNLSLLCSNIGGFFAGTTSGDMRDYKADYLEMHDLLRGVVAKRGGR